MWCESIDLTCSRFWLKSNHRSVIDAGEISCVRLALVALVVSWYMRRTGHDIWSFVASADNTLTVMRVITLIGMLLVLLYTTGVDYFFRGKVIVEPKSY